MTDSGPRVVGLYRCPREDCGRLFFPTGVEEQNGPPECNHGLFFGTDPSGGGESETELVPYVEATPIMELLERLMAVAAGAGVYGVVEEADALLASLRSGTTE